LIKEVEGGVLHFPLGRCRTFARVLSWQCWRIKDAYAIVKRKRKTKQLPTLTEPVLIELVTDALMP